MSQPTRDEAVRILREGQERVEALLEGLTEDQLTRPRTIGGGDWSAKDLVGHLATWEEVALGALREFQRGETPWVETDEGPFSAPGDGMVDEFNARTVAEKQLRPLDEVNRAARRTHAELVEAIQGLSAEEWRAKATYPTPSNRRRRLVALLGSVLGAPQQPFGHAFAHLPDLEEYVASLR